MGFQKIVHKKIGRGMGSVYNSRSLSASLKSFSLQSLWKTGLWLLDLHWKAFITSFALLQKLSDLSESSQSIYTRPNTMQRIKLCWKEREKSLKLFFFLSKRWQNLTCVACWCMGALIGNQMTCTDWQTNSVSWIYTQTHR